MKRLLLIVFTLTALLICAPLESANAVGGGFGGFGRGHGHGRGHGLGFGFGFFEDDDDLVELYRELLRNVPYYALHPPVYYSYPVPRPYGWSPFANPLGIIPPDPMCQVEPLEIINPHVPSTQTNTTQKQSDTSAAVSRQPEPLVVFNPYVTSGKALASAEK